jgi:hypothetical protein
VCGVSYIVQPQKINLFYDDVKLTINKYKSVGERIENLKQRNHSDECKKQLDNVNDIVDGCDSNNDIIEQRLP